MTQEHPITPPPALILEWCRGWNCTAELATLKGVATQAARWGADQQLELDARWLDHNALNETHLKITPIGDVLKEAMRSKQTSLSEHAIAKPLSPAAQAVLVSFRAVPDLRDGPSIAGALRSAAENFLTDWDAIRCCDFLLDMADELEAQ